MFGPATSVTSSINKASMRLRSNALVLASFHTRGKSRARSTMRWRAGSSSSACVVVLLAFVLALQGVELAQAFVPVGLQRVGHQSVVRIDLGVAAARQLGFVAGTLQLCLPPRGSLLDALRDLLLHGQRHLDGRRRHRLEQQGTDGLIDRHTVDPQARLAGLAHDLLVQR